MEDMINLSDLLKHEILDLYSAEEQIIEALPAMIDKATNGQLKKALREHLAVTKEQKNRLDQVKEWMGEDSEDNRRRGLFSRIFSGSSGSEGEKCKAMEGLITEGEKMMSADASEEVCDAAIIASAQKIEHYEISGYGTARTYARELQLNEVAQLLEQTLNEEYRADDLLTKLATGRINLEAEAAIDMNNASKARSSGGSKSSNGRSSSSSNNRSSSQQGNRTAEKKSTSERTKASSNGRSKSSERNGSSNKSSSSKSKSSGSIKSGSNGQPGKNKKSVKRSSANDKKTKRGKSGASR